MDDERCQLCGARWREGLLKCHDCGAPKRKTILPEEPAGAPLPDAAASLATGDVPVITAFSESTASAAAMPVASASASASTSAVVPAAESTSSAAAIPVASASASTSAAVPAATMPAAESTSSAAAIPISPASASTSALAPMAAPVPNASAAPVPGSPAPQSVKPTHSAPLPRPGGGLGPWPLIIGVVVLAIGGAAAFFILRYNTPPPEPAPELAPISISARGLAPPGCTDLEAIAGSWIFTTATTNARKETRIGMRGFFELQIDVADCTAQATIVKVGRKGKPSFPDHKRPRASASLASSEDGPYSFGFGARFELQNEDGQGVPLRITFAREGDQLVGAWRQVGPRWEVSGMYGVLVGERDGDPRTLRVRRSEQPCAIQCAAPEELTHLEDPTGDGIQACRSTCK